MASGDDWEEQLIEQLVEMFRNMGMNMDKEQIRGMMEQFRSQFENMGLDAEKIAKGDVNFNFDLSHLSKMFQSGKSMEDILSNLGMDVQVDASPVEIKAPEVEDTLEEVINIPANDVYLDGWNMAVTIDFTLRGEVEESELELALVRQGQRIDVIQDTLQGPLARIDLPHPCEDLVDWSLNNGILDITLKLTPQGSAVDTDDSTPEAPDIRIDLGDENDDDDEDDDGGIPIF
ncbi:MAG: zinc ribbon domain-containing protein [Candidatus Poseidoniaceae archaeon]|nr:zinc ribbon domain-containing protein [Candidatus Poseidoniaceae archaeon]